MDNNYRDASRPYKEDTKHIVEWLEDKARQIKTDAAVNTLEAELRAKGISEKGIKKALKREEKKNQQQATASATPSSSAPSASIISTSNAKKTTKDLIEQATMIAQNKKSIEVPHSFSQIITRTIEARRLRAEWFETNRPHDLDSNARHWHFIGVLSKVAEVLGHGLKKEVRGTARSEVDKPTPIEKLENPFQGLTVEGTEELEDDAPLSKESNGPDSLTTGRMADKIELEMIDLKSQEEADDRDDRIFAAFNFFENLQDIQKVVKDVWQAYGKDELDLLTASFITYAAIDFVDRQERQLTEDLFPDKEPSWHTLAYYAGFAASKDDPAEMVDLESKNRLITPYDDFLYYWTARILRKGAMFSNETSAKVSEDDPLPSLSVYYEEQRDLLITRPGMMKVLYKDGILSTLLLEVRWHNRDYGNKIPEGAKLRDGFLFPTLVPDLFRDGVIKSAKGGNLTASLVFAAQVQFEIYDTLGKEKLSRGLQNLAKELWDMRSTARLGRNPSTEKWNYEGQQVNKLDEMPAGMFKIYMSTLLYLDNCDESKKRVVRETESEDVERRWRSWKPDLHIVSKIGKIAITNQTSWLQRSSPNNYGLNLLGLKVQLEEQGLSIAKAHDSIFLVAHLYNAVRQMLILKTPWPEMERVLELHIKPIFMGERPRNGEEICKRFKQTAGLARKASADLATERVKSTTRAGVKAALKSVDTYQDKHLTCTKASSILRKLEGYKGQEKKEDILTLGQVVHQLCELAGDDLETKSLAKRQNAHLTPVETLDRLRTWLPKAFEDINVDYLTLNQTCTNLLEQIRIRYNEQKGQNLALSEEIGAKLPEYTYLLVVSLIMEENLLWKSPEMELVGKVLGAHLESEKNIRVDSEEG